MSLPGLPASRPSAAEVMSSSTGFYCDHGYPDAGFELTWELLLAIRDAQNKIGVRVTQRDNIKADENGELIDDNGRMYGKLKRGSDASETKLSKAKKWPRKTGRELFTSQISAPSTDRGSVNNTNATGARNSQHGVRGLFSMFQAPHPLTTSSGTAFISSPAQLSSKLPEPSWPVNHSPVQGLASETFLHQPADRETNSDIDQKLDYPESGADPGATIESRGNH
ncbi:hypothetical protein AAE478_003245 [Parahypoxylon ruwenzoriense]